MHALVMPTMTTASAAVVAEHHRAQVVGMQGDMAAETVTPLDNGCQTTHDHCLAVLRTLPALAAPSDVAPAPALSATAMLVMLRAAQVSDRAPPSTPSLVEIGVSRT